jgi:hypothetical protein
MNYNIDKSNIKYDIKNNPLIENKDELLIKLKNSNMPDDKILIKNILNDVKKLKNLVRNMEELDKQSLIVLK